MNANPLMTQTILACIIISEHIKKNFVTAVQRIMTADWPNLFWQNIILQ